MHKVMMVLGLFALCFTALAKNVQTITFPAFPAHAVGDANFSPGAAASSGLAVSYVSANPKVATIVGGNIHITGKGSAVITARQPGNAAWNPATPVAQTLTVTIGYQTITFDPLPDKAVGDANFLAGATASSGLPVTYASTNLKVASIVSGKAIHIAGAGTTIITAIQAGNANWNPAPQITQTLTVAPNVPTYPIAANVYTTLDKTIVPVPLPPGTKTIFPCQLAEYAANGYGLLNPEGPPAPFVRPDMQTNVPVPSVRDPFASTLLTFFSMSDIHLTDKESPAQVIFYGYEAGPLANISAYSGIILYTTHVLDAAIQTINAVHKKTPFDFGIALGDAVNNTQYNELQWYVDVIDGQKIIPCSGAHLGAKTIDYQKPYQAAGLDKTIPWYQVVGNHDQFWTGCLLPDKYVQQTLVGSSILNLGETTASYTGMLERGFYMGVVDGTKPFGDIIDAGSTTYYPTPPRITADPARRSLTFRDWMNEFLKTTTLPAGHGITPQMVNDGFCCYHFYPRPGIPLKVIVLDDTDRAGSANGALEYKRYDWLVSELDAGESAGELMIVCSHIPVRPYAPPSQVQSLGSQYYTLYASYSMISETALLQKLWSYQNLIMWVSGHVHRNAITNQPPAIINGEPPSPYIGDLTHGFWEVETPSLRDFPQEFRHFEIVRNHDDSISIFALDIDHAANPAPLPDGLSTPAWISRTYALGAHQIFQLPMQQGPNVNEFTGVYNAELVKQLSPAMQAKLALLIPAVSSFQINANGNSKLTVSQTVTLDNTVTGTTPTHYMAGESSLFSGATWQSYSNSPAFVLSDVAGTKTVYFKVKDGSGKESAVVSASIVLKE